MINYGALDAAARDLGVGVVVQKIKDFDASGRENPIGDLLKELGIDTPAEEKMIQEEERANVANEAAFRESVNAPV